MSVTRSAVTRAPIIGTVVIGAFGGAILDRAIVATPAWRQLGAPAWAAYSRHADLGNGLIVYAIYGVGLVVLAVATAISYRFDHGAPRSAGLPIYLAAASAIGVIATTIKAAPIMLGVPDLRPVHGRRRAHRQAARLSLASTWPHRAAGLSPRSRWSGCAISPSGYQKVNNQR
jgi:hypothetical protein